MLNKDPKPAPHAGQAPADANALPPNCTTPQVLLGLLITWQILFLLVDNALNVLSSAERITGDEQVGEIVDHVAGGISAHRGHWHDIYSFLRRWESIFSHLQSWRMFSPGVGDWFSFIRVEMRWDDEAPGAAASPRATRPPV